LASLNENQYFNSLQPTPESHLPPIQTLQAVREQLLSVFRHNFDQASRSRNSADTSRFFKLFPDIGWEKEGLEAYASFVVDLVRVRPPASVKSVSISLAFIL
jgi:conserved oligomeric Golgi complex subunit 4